MRILLIFLLLSTNVHSYERRLLHPENEAWVAKIDRDIEGIEHGLRIGRRKEALEELLSARRQDLQELPSFLLAKQQRISFLEQENTRLKEQLEQVGYEVACRLRLFGMDFLGLGHTEELARIRALVSCSNQYDLNLECKRARIQCVD
jgi:hypothetical protein